jgi:catechol 2,3-dioxygenase-like lactoylglutathione lyase family enzyme
MNGYLISGIQQMGIGVLNVSEAFNWYIKNFGMDCRIFEEEAEAKLMLPYTGGKPRSRHAILALNLQSGGGFEIWQYKGREPMVSSTQIQIGDLGIFACKMKVKNIDAALVSFREKNMTILGEPAEDPNGKKTFFSKDPFGNIFQFIEATDWFMEENKVTGGAYGVIIGVTDIEKSKAVYSDILGYDKVVYDKTGTFSDFFNIPGGKGKFRRILLKRSLPFSGPFSKLFGQSYIELITVVDRISKKIYEGRYWGDPGFIHLCYDIQGMAPLRKYCETKGFPFTVDSETSHDGQSFDMGEAAGHFSYIEDPDGTLIEFVETHKVPILKKIGWYMDISKRKPGKSLPTWILKTLKYSRVKG